MLNIRVLAQAVLSLCGDLPPEEHAALADAAIALAEKHGIPHTKLRLLPNALRRAERMACGTPYVSVAISSNKHLGDAKTVLAAIERALGKSMELAETHVDYALLGGVRCRIADDRLDRSLRSALNQAQSILTAP